MSGHTPGPWRAGDDDFVVRDASGNGIAWCEVPELRPERPSEQDRANARLIAAAPDMLDALKAIAAGVSFGAWNKVEAAIAKAEGRS